MSYLELLPSSDSEQLLWLLNTKQKFHQLQIKLLCDRRELHNLNIGPNCFVFFNFLTNSITLRQSVFNIHDFLLG